MASRRPNNQWVRHCVLWAYILCRPSWSPQAHHCCVSTKSQSAFLHLFLSPEQKEIITTSHTVRDTWRYHWIRCSSTKSPVEGSVMPQWNPLIQSLSFTLIDPLISEASYWAVLFMRPRMTVSREPDSAPFRAEIMSLKYKNIIMLPDWTESVPLHHHITSHLWRFFFFILIFCQGILYLLCPPFICKSDVSPLGVGPLCKDVNDGLFIHP